MLRARQPFPGWFWLVSSGISGVGRKRCFFALISGGDEKLVVADFGLLLHGLLRPAAGHELHGLLKNVGPENIGGAFHFDGDPAFDDAATTVEKVAKNPFGLINGWFVG